MKTTIFTFIMSICLALAATVTAYAQAGSLDLTFGTGGKVTTDFLGFDDKAYSVAIQSDGKIVVAGQGVYGPGWDFALLRYNSDGTLDSTFDFDGKVTTDFGGAGGQGASVAIQGDQKIVVAGQSYNGSNWDFALARYNSDGSLDNTFGSGGTVITDFAGSTDFGESVAIQGDQKIVVSGVNNNGTDDDFALVRYNTNGSLDNTFGSGGKVTTDFGGFEEGKSVVMQTNNKIVVSGYSFNGVDLEFALARYNSDGSLDNTFGTGGKVKTAIGGYDDEGLSVKIQGDDKIVVAGISNNGSNYEFALVRYNSDGTLDNTFGSGGKVTTAIGGIDDEGSSVVIQTNGRIIVAGWSSSITDNDFSLVRYNSDGTLDNTFGSGGKVTTAVGSNDDYGCSVALQNNGKIVVAGFSANGGNTDFAVVRYNNDAGTGISGSGIPQSVVTVSPNPFTNELTIKWDKGQQTPDEKEIILFDVMGKELMREKTFDGEIKLITSSLAPGIYLLSYTDGNITTNMKLIK